MVGATGFEPATSWSQTKCSSQAELRSDKRSGNIAVFCGSARSNSPGSPKAVHQLLTKCRERMPFGRAAQLRKEFFLQTFSLCFQRPAFILSFHPLLLHCFGSQLD